MVLVFFIQQAIFKYMDKFAKNLTDTLKKAQYSKHLEPQFFVSISKKIKDYFFAKEDLQMYHSINIWQLNRELKLTSVVCFKRKDHTISSAGQRQVFFVMLSNKCIFFYLDTLEQNLVGDVKTLISHVWKTSCSLFLQFGKIKTP